MASAEHLLLAARQVGGGLVDAIGAGPGTRRAGARSRRRRRVLSLRRESTPAHPQVLAHGERREHGLAAGHLADAVVARSRRAARG